MVSLKDVAAACNISVSATSKALLDYPDIGAEKKRLVQQTALSMGYVPNSSARALKTKRSHTLGVILETDKVYGMAYRSIPQVFESMLHEASMRGYDIVLMETGKLHAKNSLRYCVNMFRSKNADGGLIFCTEPGILFFECMAEEAFPLLAVDYQLTGVVMRGRMSALTPESDFQSIGISLAHELVERVEESSEKELVGKENVEARRRHNSRRGRSAETGSRKKEY